MQRIPNEKGNGRPMSNMLRGKVAVVTGSGSGIGRASAEILAERGAAVVVADLNGEAGEAVAQGIRARGFSAIAIATDVADEDQIRRMIDTSVREFGGVDILHNNAAILSPDVTRRDLRVGELDADL